MGDALGWCIAFAVTMLFVMKLVLEKFDIRAKRSTREVAVQRPVTYKTCDRLGGTVGRFTPLPERDFDAWVMMD
jgi:hypothetical protein